MKITQHSPPPTIQFNIESLLSISLKYLVLSFFLFFSVYTTEIMMIICK